MGKRRLHKWQRLVARIVPLALCATLLTPISAVANTTIYPIRGHLPDLRLELQSLHMPHFTEAALANKVAVLFFGFSHCPDICPTTMAELSEVRAHLNPAQQRQLQIVFVSVDPHRDTPALLHDYVNLFNNGAIGLTGSEKQIARLAKRYRVAYQIEKPKPGDSPDRYNVMHAQGLYIFDKQGKARYLASNAQDSVALARTLATLLDE